MKVLLLGAIALCVPAAVTAQHGPAHAPYADLAIDTTVTLPLDQVRQLRAGEGMALALVAEVNRYPGPRHALDLASELRLSDTQIARLGETRRAMADAARAKGTAILEAEAALTTLFRSGSASVDDVEALTGRIGRLYGELRAIHLRAHLDTRNVLTADQVRAYDVHRGYRREHPHAAGLPG